jgi:hypothetical protein
MSLGPLSTRATFLDWLSTRGEPAHLRLEHENLRHAQMTTVTSPGNL